MLGFPLASSSHSSSHCSSPHQLAQPSGFCTARWVQPREVRKWQPRAGSGRMCRPDAPRRPRYSEQRSLQTTQATGVCGAQGGRSPGGSARSGAVLQPTALTAAVWLARMTVRPSSPTLPACGLGSVFSGDFKTYTVKEKHNNSAGPWSRVRVHSTQRAGGPLQP